MIKRGVNNYSKFPVMNSSVHHTILKKNMITGRMEPIKSLVPIEVILQTMITSTQWQGAINQSNLGRY